VTVTIYHNPQCSTSRTALALLRERGVEPEIVDYKTVGWTRPLLQTLAKDAKVPVSGFLRRKEALAVELGLTGEDASEAALLDAMVAHPILVDRPIVRGPNGVVLGRPAERVLEVI